MPKVGKGQKAVNYPYSKKGIKDAVAHSKRTGEPVSMEYGHGGMIPKYNLGGMVPRPKPIPRPMPRPRPGTGMTPPVNRGTMGGRMNPAQKKALMKRLAKFKKGIV